MRETLFRIKVGEELWSCFLSVFLPSPINLPRCWLYENLQVCNCDRFVGHQSGKFCGGLIYLSGLVPRPRLSLTRIGVPNDTMETWNC